ncbi:MAG: hypothetical protein HDR24_05915 [Lachnospiraceae bacterium]|nr:hypothetical protein [Lachnospiraceae bacterium]
MNLRIKSMSIKAGLASAVLNVITLIAFCIYGLVYDYFDTVVFLTFLLGIVFNGLYIFMNRRITNFFNLFAVVCLSFGVGLFFLNSYPVWADRLNHITMYGSRGTLVPVVTIIILCLVTIILGIVSCFTGKEGA